MSTFLLIRSKPLTQSEARRLPSQTQILPNAHPVIARLEVDANLPAKELVRMTVWLARGIPDAELVFQKNESPEPVARAKQSVQPPMEAEVIDDGWLHPSSTLQPPSHSPELSTATETVITSTPLWWEDVETGDHSSAMAKLTDHQMDNIDNLNVRRLLNHGDAAHQIFICNAARHFGWKSLALRLRNLLTSEHPELRVAALMAIGDLAGPALSSTVRAFFEDPDARVRRAAAAAYGRLNR